MHRRGTAGEGTDGTGHFDRAPRTALVLTGTELLRQDGCTPGPIADNVSTHDPGCVVFTGLDLPICRGAIGELATAAAPRRLAEFSASIGRYGIRTMPGPNC